MRLFISLVLVLVVACHQDIKKEPIEVPCEQGNISRCETASGMKEVVVLPWGKVSLSPLVEAMSKIEDNNDVHLVIQTSGNINYHLKTDGKEAAWAILGPQSWIAVTDKTKVYFIMTTNQRSKL